MPAALRKNKTSARQHARIFTKTSVSAPETAGIFEKDVSATLHFASTHSAPLIFAHGYARVHCNMYI